MKRPKPCPICGEVDLWELPDGSSLCDNCGYEERAR